VWRVLVEAERATPAPAAEYSCCSLHLLSNLAFPASYVTKNNAAPGADPAAAEASPAPRPRKPPLRRKPSTLCMRVLMVSKGKRTRSTLRPAMAPAVRYDHQWGERVVVLARARAAVAVAVADDSDSESGAADADKEGDSDAASRRV